MIFAIKKTVETKFVCTHLELLLFNRIQLFWPSVLTFHRRISHRQPHKQQAVCVCGRLGECVLSWQHTVNSSHFLPRFKSEKKMNFCKTFTRATKQNKTNTIGQTKRKKKSQFSNFIFRNLILVSALRQYNGINENGVHSIFVCGLCRYTQMQSGCWNFEADKGKNFVMKFILIGWKLPKIALNCSNGFRSFIIFISVCFFDVVLNLWSFVFSFRFVIRELCVCARIFLEIRYI